jgi:hypothetical protein
MGMILDRSPAHDLFFGFLCSVCKTVAIDLLIRIGAEQRNDPVLEHYQAIIAAMLIQMREE